MPIRDGERWSRELPSVKSIIQSENQKQKMKIVPSGYKTSCPIHSPNRILAHHLTFWLLCVCTLVWDKSFKGASQAHPLQEVTNTEMHRILLQEKLNAVCGISLSLRCPALKELLAIESVSQSSDPRLSSLPGFSSQLHPALLLVYRLACQLSRLDSIQWIPRYPGG